MILIVALVSGSCNSNIEEEQKALAFDRQLEFISFSKEHNVAFNDGEEMHIMFMPPNFCEACLISAGKLLTERCESTESAKLIILYSEIQDCIGEVMNCENISCIPYKGEKAQENGLIDPYPILVSFKGEEVVGYLAVI